MLRASGDRVKAMSCGQRRAALGTAIALLAIWSSGCYWARYPRLMETHLALLLEFADKLQGFAAEGRRVPPQAWGEFTYPLERAQDFSRIAAQRFPGRRSLVAFDRTLEIYSRLVSTPDILARPDAAADVAQQLARLRDAVAETRAALAQEASA